MSRYTGPVCRLCRREGEKLFLKGVRCESPKCALQRKSYAPGAHGNKSSFSQKSEYAKQLRAKQKAKRIYNVNSENQFKKYYSMAILKPGVTGEILFETIETRLDNVLYRANFASSRAQGRQIANHGLIKLNGKRVSIPSILVKIGDKIEVIKKTKENKLFADLNKRKDIAPKWLKADLSKGTIDVIAMPTEKDIEQNIEGQLIVELYSK
ncbi:MAG: 30S ribosomal protein S4 [Candidatus Gracilibacteria bacterium]|jgi:small subunit ribosomal protein S4